MGRYSSWGRGWGGFAPYVSVAELEAKAAQTAARIAKEHVGITVDSIGEKELKLTCKTTDQEVAQMIGQMIAQQVLVTGFHKQEGNLESSFMELTGGAEHAAESNH